MEETDEFLKVFVAGGGEEGVLWVVACFLMLTVVGCCPWMGRMFRYSGHAVVEYMSGLGAIIRHIKVHRAPLVVSVEVDTEEDFALPIDGTSVFLEEVIY